MSKHAESGAQRQNLNEKKHILYIAMASISNSYKQGRCYLKGDGVEKDPVKAARWFRIAAEKGNNEAQFNLAVMYRKGVGVATDLKEAVKWYKNAALQGDVRAQSNLGVMYEKGLGTSKNIFLYTDFQAEFRHLSVMQWM